MNNKQDWASALQSLMDNGNLPQGDTTAPTPTEPKPSKKGKLVLSYEKKGRGGKQVTIISGFAPDEDIELIASQLKRKLGAGGSARGGEILIQGDRRNELKTILKDRL